MPITHLRVNNAFHIVCKPISSFHLWTKHHPFQPLLIPFLNQFIGQRYLSYRQNRPRNENTTVWNKHSSCNHKSWKIPSRYIFAPSYISIHNEGENQKGKKEKDEGARVYRLQIPCSVESPGNLRKQTMSTHGILAILTISSPPLGRSLRAYTHSSVPPSIVST